MHHGERRVESEQYPTGVHLAVLQQVEGNGDAPNAATVARTLDKMEEVSLLLTWIRVAGKKSQELEQELELKLERERELELERVWELA